MAQVKRFIAFDLGAESGRCVVGEMHGSLLKLNEVYRFDTPMIRYRYNLLWDVLLIFQELVTGLTRAVEVYGPEYEGISLDTWGVDYVLLDDDNRLLGYPYHYRDSRTDGMMEKAFEMLPREQIYAHTGIQFVQFNTLFQLLAEREQQVNFIEIAERFLPIPNFLLYLLSGVQKAEYTIASTTQLTDPRHRDWSREILDGFHLPEHIFPPIVEPGTVLGPLLPEVVRQTGVDPETPVIAGASHDTAAAVASIPAQTDGWAFLSSGTWSLMGLELEHPLINAQALHFNVTNEGGVAGTTRFLKNIMGLWPLQECRRYWAQEGTEYAYDRLQQLAEEAGYTEAWVDVDDARFLKPGNMPEKIIAFLKETDQPFREDVGWIARCVLESLAFKYRQTIQGLEDLTGDPVPRLHAVGGGIQNTLLNQLTADAIGREVITGPVEGTGAGNIGVQAIARGVLPDLQAFRNLVGESFELVSYQPEQQDYWEQNEKRYRGILAD